MISTQVASSRALAKGDAHHAEPLVCEASAATLEVLARHAPLRVLACGAATQAFASLAERCAHPGLRAAQRSLLDLLWFWFSSSCQLPAVRGPGPKFLIKNLQKQNKFGKFQKIKKIH